MMKNVKENCIRDGEARTPLVVSDIIKKLQLQNVREAFLINVDISFCPVDFILSRLNRTCIDLVFHTSSCKNANFWTKL